MLSNIISDIFAFLFVGFFILFFVGILASAYSPTFKAKLRREILRNQTKFDRVVEKIADFFAEIIIFSHDSFVTTILLVLATSGLYTEISPMIDQFHGIDKFMTDLNGGFTAHPAPFVFMFLIFFIWLLGFAFKHSVEIEEKKKRQEWQRDVSDSLNEICKSLRGDKKI